TILGNILFPASLRGFWFVGLAAVLVAVFLSALLLRQAVLRPLVWLPCLVLSITVGGFAIWAQLPPPATTTPLNEQPPAMVVNEQQPISNTMISCGPHCKFD